MKQYSNTYIFIFSSVMVTIVAILLSFAAINLKPLQDKNIEVEKKQDILKSVKKAQEIKEVSDKKEYIEKEYKKYITESFVVNSEGEKIEGIDAFTIDLKKEFRKQLEKRNLPVFVFTNDDQSHKYILPLRGKGLWGDIWGYISLNEDFNTVYGATFDHESETPGLGAEINTPEFQKQFGNKKLFNDNKEFISVKVLKGGAPKENVHGVDAISGGTITSKALEAMLFDCLSSYEHFLIKNQNQHE